MKQNQHVAQSKLKTRSSSRELYTGLPLELVTCRQRFEVPHSPTVSHPQVGLFKQPLSPSNSLYQESPPSSSDSTTIQLLDFTINHGAVDFARKKVSVSSSAVADCNIQNQPADKAANHVELSGQNNPKLGTEPAHDVEITLLG